MVMKLNWSLTLPSSFLMTCFVHDEPRASQLKMNTTSMNKLFFSPFQDNKKIIN